jgi:hypothetical protein
MGMPCIVEADNPDTGFLCDMPPRSGQLGPLQTEKTKGEPPFYLKHWFLIEGFEGVVCIAFIVAALYAFIIN